jgi:hypothetical protein
MMNGMSSLQIKVGLFSICFVLGWAACSNDQFTQDEWQGEILVEDGVEIILNPDRPISPNAGRDLSLEEVLRISDNDAEGAFYFTYPSLQEADDGSIFIGGDRQLLKFSPQGQFLGNLFKAGQGPGEIADSSPDYFLWKDSIFVCDPNNSKVLWMNQDGVLLSEDKINERRGGLIGLTAHWEVYRRIEPPMPSPSFVEWGEEKHSISWFSRNSLLEKKSYTFTTRKFRSRGIYKGPDWFCSVLDPVHEHLYVSHTGKYSVSVLDLNQKRVIRRFQRDYPRVKWVTSDEERELLNIFDIPLQKYWYDILRMYVVRGQLWVETSFKDEREMTLVDVFDIQGKYIDSFYLGLEERTIRGVAGDSLFISERDENELISIVKYRIVDDAAQSN